MTNKPCDSPCPKCSSTNIYLRFINKGKNVEPDPFYHNPYLDESKITKPFCFRAAKDHLAYRCRCCGFLWFTLPADKLDNNDI